MLWHWSSMKATPLDVVETPPRDDLVEDPKELERVGGADDEVVVGVEATS